MKYPLPLEVFLPNGLSGRHPPSGGLPSEARGGGGGRGGDWRQKFCRYSPRERVLRCGIPPPGRGDSFPAPLPELHMRNRNQNIFKFKSEHEPQRRPTCSLNLPVLTVFKAIFTTISRPTGTAHAEPEPKYFQVQVGTRTPQQRPACIPELTCVDSFRRFFQPCGLGLCLLSSSMLSTL